MAYRTVELTDEEKKGNGGRKFKKFEAIGDKYIGILLAVETATKTFKVEEGPKQTTTYIFWGGKDGECGIDPPFDLKRQLAKAMRPVSEGGFGLQPYNGNGKPALVRMEFKSTQDIGKADPMKIFKVDVDDSPNIPAESIRAIPVQGQQSSSKPAQPPAPPPPDDDIPF